MMILMNKKIKIKFAELLDICKLLINAKNCLTIGIYDNIIRLDTDFVIIL